MNILFLYPNNEGYFRCPVGLTLIMTVLKNEGHKIKLFDTTFMNVEDNIDSKVREKVGMAKPVPMDHLFEKRSEKEIIAEWLRVIEDFKPDLIGASILEDAYEFCGTLLDAAKEKFDVPIVVGGVTPTISPNIVIEHPSIDMIVQGEGEVAFKELANTLEKNNSLSKVPNLWYKESNGSVVKNGLIQYMDINELPNQNLDFWDPKHFLKPYDGVMYKSGFFEMSRGCMHKCHYCFNRYMQVGLKDAGKYRRNKTTDKIITEIKELHKKNNFELILFTDDNFLARSFAEMDEFYERWSKELGIPYWMNTCIETLNEKNLPQLKKSNCVGIGIGMETGSEWVRKNLLLKGKMSNEMYLEGFKLMASHGIRSTCNSMIGFPGEYEEDFFETIKLNKKIRSIDQELTSCDVCFVAPYSGTVIHNICLELGLFTTYAKPGYRGLCKNITMRKEPVINNPTMSKEKMIELHANFSDYINGKKDIPENFLFDDPERKYAEGNPIYEVYERYKKGPIDIDPNNFDTSKNFLFEKSQPSFITNSQI